VLWVGILLVVSVVVSALPIALQWRDQRMGTRAIRVLTGQARRIAATPVDRLPEGSLARSIGKVRPSGPWLVAPFSKTPCAYWRFTASVLEYSGTQRRMQWQVMFDDSQSRVFALKDPTGTCIVDPELATVDLAIGSRFHHRRGRIPASVVDVFDRYGVELPDAAILIEETTLAVDTTIGVAGIVRRIDQPDVVETDYRSGRPTIASYDGTLGDLLITTDRRLEGAAATATPARGEPAWGLPAVDEHGRPMAPLDEFEADLRRRGGRRIVIGCLALATVASFSAVLVFAGLHRPPAPLLDDDHRAEIAETLARSRTQLHFDNGDWHNAMWSRNDIGISGEPCAYARWLDDRLSSDRGTWRRRGVPRLATPFAYVAIDTDTAVPIASPRSEDAVIDLAEVAGELADGALDARANELLDRAMLRGVDKVDLLIEVDREHHHERAWLYDHGMQRIACAGEAMFAPGADLVELAATTLYAASYK
jgi:hypothetical protein